MSTISQPSNSQNVSYSQQVHVYPGTPSNLVDMQPRTQLSSAIFMPEKMRAEILARNQIANHTEINPGWVVAFILIF